MASGNFVLHKLMRAAVAWLQTQAPLADIPAASILPGLNRTKRAKPCVLCIATAAENSDHLSGNKRTTLTVEVISDTDEEGDTERHFDRVEAVANALNTDTIAADLTAALAHFTVFLCQPAGESFGVTEDTDWISSVSFTVDCCGSDVD